MTLPPENVEHYPRPPLLEPVPQRIRIILGGETIVDSVRSLRICETHHPPAYYVPPEDVAPGAVSPAAGSSFCEWKGRAAYWDVNGGGVTRLRAAWSYPAPTSAYRAIAAHLCFYAGPMDACFVGDCAVSPQPGDFYGGWVTPNLQGRIKGGPGTLGW